MPHLLRLAALALVLALPGVAAAQGADAVTSSAPRVLAEGTQTLKGDDGRPVTLHSELVYHPIQGEYIRTVTDVETGAVHERTLVNGTHVRPTEAEEALAQTLIRTDTELAGLIAAADHEVVVSGGFPLVRDDSAECGPDDRCLMYDIYELQPGELAAQRIRYVVVDLRTAALVSSDLDPVTEANRSRPASDR